MKSYFERISFSRLLIIGVIVRLILSPLSFHSDLNTNVIWGIYARDFGLRGFYDWLNFGNYARPDYPPFAILLFLFSRIIWQGASSFLWFLNITIPLFPSNIVSWFDIWGNHALIKIPGIAADIGIALLIYRYFSKKKTSLNPKLLASLFLFNPAIIYLSSSWGQLDSIVGFFGLLSVILVLSKSYFSAATAFFVSIMTKVTMLPAALTLVIQSIKDKISLKKILHISLLVIFYGTALGTIFIDRNPLGWLMRTYWKIFLPGAATLPYINLNAFNFWGLVLGLARIPDSQAFLGISLFVWAWAITILFLALITYKFIKGADIFAYLVLTFFCIFIFMPRVHERYLYPVFVFYPFLLAKLPALKWHFLILSAVFLFNLYHWWWFPKIPPLVSFFSLELVERTLSFVNVAGFGYLLWKYLLL